MFRVSIPQPNAGPEALRRRVEAALLPNNLFELLETCASDSADRIAMDFFEDGRQITYGDFAADASKAAQGLKGLGVRKASRVALMTPNILENLVAWFALLKLGAVTVPINPNSTTREIDFMLGDSGADILITVEDLHEKLLACESMPKLRATVTIGAGALPGGVSWSELLVSDTATGIADEPVQTGDLANIQYTSGTTGFPKGCLLTHEYWLKLGWVVAEEIETSLDKLLVPQPLFYMEPLYVLIMSMFNRATFCCARRISSTRLLDWIKTLGINYCNFPELVLRQPQKADDRENELRLVHGFGINPARRQEIEDRFGTIAREAYGTTELGAVLYVPRAATEKAKSATCGIPAPFREVKILRPDNQPAAAGELGELWVRGPGISLGYNNRPDATKRAHVDGWFRTGDLFTMDQEGWYRFEGRLNDVIRRSSEFISAYEVEHVISKLEAVRQVAVVSVADDRRGEEVRACIVLGDEAAPDALPPATIAAHCVTALAPFKVPRFITYLPTLPMTANGDKVDKPRLQQVILSTNPATFDRETSQWS
ncbi:class I adenylate-forming enzyme family protein [Mesorhizobium sp. M7A.F.Ca.MR.176.00.0.0]|uniref:class I adenylate-forming enzyme family protein n=1 Tax=unclassified Mesorhizobium TaxID=325217 RepID=UPI0013E407A5|nr:class I adenylate-forming enzyme family protein [Mesorhizobium sp. M7A.F.Ca.MR.176.00.0.0]